MYEKPPKELQEHWDAILRKEGLTVNRGQRLSKSSRSLREEDEGKLVTCWKCIGHHTEAEGCSFGR